MDGVWADFIKGFRMQARAINPGVEIFGHERMRHWDDMAGMSEKEVELTWDAVKRSRDFWALLPLCPLFGAVEEFWKTLGNGGNLYNLYFATNRVGLDPKGQTERWLRAHLKLRSPTVMISKFKGELAKALSIDYAIDDKAENAFCIAWLSPKTKSYILDRKYNRYEVVGSKKVRRVTCLEEFFEDVKKGV
jgi:hypothetical protein